MRLVDLKDISFSYDGGKTFVLQGISLQVDDGEHVALVGPNGCGKSTLAKIAAGLLSPDGGSVTLLGKECFNFMPGMKDKKIDVEAYSQVRRQIGYVFQDPQDQLITECVATELAFTPQNLLFTVEQIDQMVALELEKAGLSQLAERSLDELSGGEQQLVAVASAVACNPKLLVLDEPTAYLDTDNAKHLNRMIEKLTDRCAVLHITHKPEEIKKADRVIGLNTD